jgi:capsular polysaccharide biosynthesis protein
VLRWSLTPGRDERTSEGAPSANKGTTLDFWDLGRVVGRRWRISVPLFVLAIAMTALIFTQVKPDYVATAYVQLVPPTPAAVPAGQPQRPQRNPWLSQDLSTIGTAALVTVQDVGYIQSLKDEGYSDSFTATMGENSPLITIQVTGKSLEQASGTADQLAAKFDKSLNSLQAAYGVADVDLITSKRLDGGTNVAKSSSNVKRAVAAVGIVGLLLALAVTIAVDAWLRRRARAKAARAAGAVSEAVPLSLNEPSPPAVHWVPDRSDTSVLTMTRIFTPANGNGARTADRPPPESRPSERPPADIRSTDRGPVKAAPKGFDRADNDIPADATVVLPRATPVSDE